jgi:hypothetical protein
MIFMDLDELGWEPYMREWIKKKKAKGKEATSQIQDLLKGFVEKYVPKVLKVKKTQCRELCKTSETACVRNLCQLFDALCSKLLDFKATEE